MDTWFKDIRPSDWTLAAITSALGVVLMIGNISGFEDGARVDSTSWLTIPVFLAATVPLLWRRRNTMAVILVAAAAMAAHVAAFGWMVRCGAGLPLALILAYTAGRFIQDRMQSILALVLTVGVQVLVLVRDSVAGLEIMPVTGLVGVALWGVGRYVRGRTQGQPHHADLASPVASGS